MFRTFAVVAVIMTFAAFAAYAEEAKKNPTAIIETSLGEIEIELFADKAPKTVANFKKYADAKFYDGTIFHRVMDGFMVQGGGFTPDLKQKDTKDPVRNEADNGLRNEIGTVAMARTDDPHSATAEFYINVANNDFLNHKDKSKAGWGYCVFGKVIKGMDVVEKIKKVKVTTEMGEIMGMQASLENVPVEAVIIKTARVKE